MTATTIPVLPSRDFGVTSEFYRGIGFTEEARYPGEYLIVRHPERIELHFWLDTALDPATNAAGCYARYDTAGEARALHAQWAATGLGLDNLKPPTDTDYGLVEFALLDPDRNLIRVGGTTG